MGRKVIIASAKANKAIKVENFTGTTFADLLSATSSDGVTVSSLYESGSVDVIVKPGNVTLRGNDSILPEGDFSAFFVATKNKAGITDSDAKELGTAITKTIKEASRLASSEEKTALKNSLTEAINNYYNIDVSVDSDLRDAELQAALLEAQSM